MPCGRHPSSSDKKCVECFVSDILNLDPKSKKTKEVAADLGRRFEGLTLTPDQEDLCLPIIASINVQLDGTRIGDVIAPGDILDTHRNRYRARLRRMGTWIGFYELEVLARIYDVGFFVAIPIGNGRWRRYQIGEGCTRQIPNPALCWTGVHFELGSLTVHMGAEYNRGAVRETNKRGDCGIESFLLLLFISPHFFQPPGTLGMMEKNVLNHFRRVAKRAGLGNIVDREDYDYYLALSGLRDILAAQMTNPEVNDAIIAEGVLPQSRSESDKDVTASWHDIMNVDDARKLALAREKLDPVAVAVLDSGFDPKHWLLKSTLTVHGVGKDPEHGTLCCGLIAGDASVEEGFLGGVARLDDEGKLQVSMHATQYGTGDTGAAEDVATCVGLMGTHGVRVVSMSYRTTGERLSVLADEVVGQAPEGIFVVSAGNEGRTYETELRALGQACIVVTATSLYAIKGRYVEKRIKDCNCGVGVTVCAPGSGTEGAEDGMLSVLSTSPGGGVGPHTNTSSATPMVAGVVALMLAVNPALTLRDVKDILCGTARKIDAEGGEWRPAKTVFNRLAVPPSAWEREYSIHYGFGSVDAAAAVAEAIRRIVVVKPVVVSGVGVSGGSGSGRGKPGGFKKR